MDRKYPVGIQTFSEIRKGNYIYIDKTDLVWEVTRMKFVFLSRPRRFGKSLLTTTLDSYFKGQKELFEGLKIMGLEKEWESYPVIHIDLSVAKNQSSHEELRETMMYMMGKIASQINYVAEPAENSPGKLLSGIIQYAYQQTGKQVAVIIDEYDAPLLDVLHEEELLPEYRRVMQEFYQPLKASEAMLRFCFITGITKFSQLSIFSTINNLTNISMDSKYAAICGITEDEFATDMAPDIAMLAEEYECTPAEMHEKLKLQYDGYRFAGKSPDIYNPFSLLKCFNQRQISNYWFESGTPMFLIRQMRHFGTDITLLDSLEEPSSSFDRPTESLETALPLLYQSGYLTIKGYDRDSEMYSLGIPNKEVRVGFVQGLLPMYVGLDGSSVQKGFALKLWRALKISDIETAMDELKAYLASVPYVEGFKKKLADAAFSEGFYEYTFYLIFSMLNVYVKTQVKCHGGRIDFVALMPDTTYIFEFKTNGTAQDAIEQINSKGYDLPYRTEGRKVVKIGVQFDCRSMTVGDYIVEKD